MRRDGLELFEGGAATGPRLLTGSAKTPVIVHREKKYQKGCCACTIIPLIFVHVESLLVCLWSIHL